MLRFRSLSMLCSLTVVWAGQSVARADDPTGMPTLKFFYFDQGKVEWVVSAEPDRLQNHLAENSDSATLYESLQASVHESPDIEKVKAGMTRWLARERERSSDVANRSNNRVRFAEGVVAYLRAHDFEIRNLVASLLRRSGAQDVELAVVHLVDRSGNASFKLKVMLPYDEVQINRQGFDVVLANTQVTYTSVVYALALALYEVHEIVNAESGDDAGLESEDGSTEDLPLPEALTSSNGFVSRRTATSSSRR